jgi:hypothetical protein
MGQQDLDVSANRSTAVVDAENGILIFSIPAAFHGEDCVHTYSLWQIGDEFKIGLLLTNGLDQAPVLDVHVEIDQLWHDVPHTLQNKGGATIYEWAFHVPTLYDSWTEQEKFVRGMKHCKQRVLRIIHDYALLKSSSK